MVHFLHPWLLLLSAWQELQRLHLAYLFAGSKEQACQEQKLQDRCYDAAALFAHLRPRPASRGFLLSIPVVSATSLYLFCLTYFTSNNKDCCFPLQPRPVCSELRVRGREL